MIALPHETKNDVWITAYIDACLHTKNPGTIDVYQRVLRDFLLWFTHWLGYPHFHPAQLTRTAIETYLLFLEEKG